MSDKVLVAGGAALVLAAAFFVADGSSESEPAEGVPTASNPYADATSTATRPVQREWVEVGQWNGSGNRTTERFSIEGDQWRVVYEGRFPASIPFGIIGFVVRTATGDVVTTASSETEQQEVTYVQSGPGTYYLDISATMNWGMVVQDYRPISSARAAERASVRDDLRNQ